MLSVQAHQAELRAERERRALAKLATAHERPRVQLTLLRILGRTRPAPCEAWQPCPDPATS
jgi:hypothetical protein